MSNLFQILGLADKNDRTASALFKGLDIYARAQFWEGFSGAPANSVMKRLGNKASQLKFIQNSANEIAPNASPLWWEDGEVGFYRPVYKAVSNRLKDDVSADDVMAEALASDVPIFWKVGRLARTGPKATGIESGELRPKDVTGLSINLMIKEALDYANKISNRRRIEEEQAALIAQESTGVGGFDSDEWSMILDAMSSQPNHPLAREFFSWLKKKLVGADSSSARVMNQYLDLALTGKYKSEAEIARAMGMPSQAYLNRVVREFTERAADILAKGGKGGDIQKIRDMLSDAAFLNQLLKGRVPGALKAAKLLAKARKLAALRKASATRLLSASDYETLLRQATKHAEAEKEGKFEKGKPADPTENMSAEDAAEWERQNEANKDKFKTAASGLYGFAKSAEKSCTGAAGKLAKYAAKLAKELYTKDADAAPFLEEHAKRGFKTAKMLRSAMADVGPGPAPKTAASKSGMGLYGFKDRTAKLAMEACSELHQAAGHLAADLAAKFGEKQDGAAFLKKHAKAAKCAFSDLILDSYPTAPVKVAEKPPVASKAPAGKKAFVDPTVDEILSWDRAVANRMATSFLAAEDDSDILAEDLISEWDAEVMAGRTWGGPNYRPKPVDDSIPYNSHPESPPAGANGSAERRRYNKWFRENVCPDHATNCGL